MLLNPMNELLRKAIVDADNEIRDSIIFFLNDGDFSEKDADEAFDELTRMQHDTSFDEKKEG